MAIGVFTPYGTRSEESGIIYLLSNYVRGSVDKLWQIRCNGAFPVCERDRDSAWSRDLGSCPGCMIDQSRLATWSNAEVVNLSSFLAPEEIEITKHWAVGITAQNLFTAEVEGWPIFKLCAESIEARLGKDGLGEIQVVRNYMLASARAALASRRLLEQLALDYLFVAGGQDCLARAFLEAARGTNVEPIVFRWRPAEHTIVIRRGDSGTALDCPLLLENVASMRSNPQSWPPEITKVMDSILEYVGLIETQLELPLAR